MTEYENPQETKHQISAFTRYYNFVGRFFALVVAGILIGMIGHALITAATAEHEGEFEGPGLIVAGFIIGMIGLALILRQLQRQYTKANWLGLAMEQDSPPQLRPDAETSMEVMGVHVPRASAH